MRGRTGGPVAAVIASLALIATACGGGGAEPEPGASQPAGQTGGEIVVAGCTPENPLVPGGTSEVCGGDIIDAMTSKLVEYNTENAAPENDIAESIETSDNKARPGATSSPQSRVMTTRNAPTRNARRTPRPRP